MKCEGNIGETVEQKERLCNKEEIVRKSTYLGDSESGGGECDVIVFARLRCVWIKF